MVDKHTPSVSVKDGVDRLCCSTNHGVLVRQREYTLSSTLLVPIRLICFNVWYHILSYKCICMYVYIYIYEIEYFVVVPY